MTQVQLGLRANWVQFSLLILVNAFVGGMAGLERSILPAIAEEEFGIAARTAILSFIVAFGLTKAASNYLAGRLAGRFGRKPLLVAGWLIAVPVPFILMEAPHWNWIVAANVLLGISQGLTWSVTVIMKIDLAGPQRRGLAIGLNEFAGYVAVAGSAFATAWIASIYGLRPEPFYLGVAFVVFGLGLSVFAVRETRGHAAHEAALQVESVRITESEVFRRTSLTDRNLSAISQAGLVKNLNDGMAWGLFPLWFAAAGMSLGQIGFLAAVYPVTWGVVQIATGAWSDRIGRKRLIVAGMWLQALAIVMILLIRDLGGATLGAVLLGIGTAMVYPTLLAAVGDHAHPAWRASAVGVYRLWRDLGYAIGALFAGLISDLLGFAEAIAAVAALTFLSGVIVAVRMNEDRS